MTEQEQAIETQSEVGPAVAQSDPQLVYAAQDSASAEKERPATLVDSGPLDPCEHSEYLCRQSRRETKMDCRFDRQRPISH